MIAKGEWLMDLGFSKGKTVGVLLLLSVLVIGGFFWWWTSSSLAKAEKLEEQAKIEERITAALEEQRRQIQKQHDKDREAWTEQMAVLARSVVTTNANANRMINQVLAPKAASEVQSDAKKILGVEPEITTDNTFRVTMADMQNFTAIKLDRDRWEQNAKDYEKRAELLEKANETLRQDLAQATEVIRSFGESAKTMEAAMQAYKKEAKKTKLKRAFEVSTSIGLGIAAAYFGNKLAGGTKP